ncbi:MAG: PD40 domain-containing protein [Solirubrobacterales bacterium]|nr:PD40 domain-containing protein [Solirubrobacterales bacterium]
MTVRRAVRMALLAVFALAATAGITAQARALSPAPPQGKVVYSNGGRILVMNADGTGREVIFGKKRNPKNDNLGAVEPATSPDGKTVVFAFKRQHGIHDLFDIWRVGIDGQGARRILKSTARAQYGDPVFMPDGRILAAFFREKRRATRTGLISLGTNGGNRATEYLITRRNRPFVAPELVMEPDAAADGDRVLFVLNSGFGGINFDEGFENSLMVLNLTSGKTRKVAEDAYDAAWSPNGRLIAYSLQTEDDDLETCWWESGCEFEATLAVVRADGSSGWVVNGRGIDERSPDWSRDGRIVFHSARNLPGTGEASEIWSVRPNGKCLTPLTNDSPASLTPAWVGSGRSNTTPAGCEKLPADSMVDLRIPDSLGSNPEVFWIGERADHRLLTNASPIRGGGQFLYYDCDLQRRSGCLPPVGLWSVDVCAYEGQIAGVFSEAPSIRRQRGVTVFLGNDTEIGRFAFLFAGRSTVFFFGGSGKGSKFGEREVARLRKIGEESVAGNLPLAAFPASDIHRMKRVSRVFKATGSVVKTARRTGLRPVMVRANLKFARGLAVYDGFDTVRCARPD